MVKRNELAGRSTPNVALRAIRGGMRRVALRTFELWPRLGVWLLPKRYDDPIPDPAVIASGRHLVAVELPGVDLDVDGGLARLAAFAADYGDEWRAVPDRRPTTGWDYYRDNPSYGAGDAAVLHGFVRSLRPKRVVEVGSGMSTRVIAAALARNDAPCTYEVVDPYPGDVVAAGIPGVQLHVASGESMPLDFYTSLGADDVLFIDSSHMLKAGSDCERLFLDVLPRLQPGVVVHIHDIYLPFDYPDGVYRLRWYWNEQYVLRALLTNNAAYEVLLANFAVYRAHRQAFADHVPGVDADTPDGGPCSIWLRVR